MSSEEGWDQWFEEYERFILHYARIAKEEGVDLFCIGTELTTAARQRQADWRRIVKVIRSVYDGPLVYAANWLEEYEHVAFWDALDYVGINAFFPLSPTLKPSPAELRRNARALADSIETIAHRTRKPVIFTEVGFKSVSGSSVEPWSWTRRYDAVDLQEQVECYRAILEAFWDRPWFCRYVLVEVVQRSTAGWTTPHRLHAAAQTGRAAAGGLVQKAGRTLAVAGRVARLPGPGVGTHLIHVSLGGPTQFNPGQRCIRVAAGNIAVAPPGHPVSHLLARCPFERLDHLHNAVAATGS